jgi:hypothetical protein
MSTDGISSPSGGLPLDATTAADGAAAAPAVDAVAAGSEAAAPAAPLPGLSAQGRASGLTNMDVVRARLEEQLGRSQGAAGRVAAPSTSGASGPTGVGGKQLGYVSDRDKLPRAPMDALAKLTQFVSDDEHCDTRCGATSVVAAVVAKKGYAGLRDFVASIKEEKPDAPGVGDLQALADKIAKGGGTYGDLGKLASQVQALYRASNRETRDDGMDGSDISHLMGLAGFSFQRENVKIDPQLQMGSCWPVKVPLEDGVVGKGKEGSHWVMAGRDNDGKMFIFDPWPREGKGQIVRERDPDWQKYHAVISQADEDARNRRNTTCGFPR